MLDFEWLPVERNFKTELRTTRIITQKEKIFCNFERGDVILVNSSSSIELKPKIYGDKNYITHASWHAEFYNSNCSLSGNPSKPWTCPRSHDILQMPGNVTKEGGHDTNLTVSKELLSKI